MLNSAKRIVIKTGSSLLVDENNQVHREWLTALVDDIRALKTRDAQVIVVTSGAVALGRSALGYGSRALTLEEKQAAAACGQVAVFGEWAQAMKGAFTPAQLLLTADDSIHRKRYLNARNTLETLLEHPRVVPVINENDTVATAELKFGDNDRLAARVAQMASADCLVLFSDIDGLYSADPNADPGAQFISEVRAITPAIEAMAGGSGSSVGTGGMITKLQAAKIAVSAGCHMAIARGTAPHPLNALMQGGKATWFIAADSPMRARKRWIAGSLHPAGSLIIDDGAAKALASGKSLLPAGVRDVEGHFERGDAVLIKDLRNRLLGKGLAAYSAPDTLRIKGKQSQEIEGILGFKGRVAVVHRDDMAVETGFLEYPHPNS